MSEELKPCPFCGSENVRFESEKHAVVCMRCKARGCVAPTEEMALDMWSDRVGDSHDEAAAAWNSRADAKELVVRFNVSDEQVRRMVDEAVRAAIDDCVGRIRKAVGE